MRGVFFITSACVDKFEHKHAKTLWINDSLSSHLLFDESSHAMILVGYSITNFSARIL